MLFRSQDNWDDWSYKFDSVCGSLDDGLCKLMRKAEITTTEITDQSVKDWELEAAENAPQPGQVDCVKLTRELHQQLVAYCNGQAATIVKSNRTLKNGVETWRRLFAHFAVRNTVKAQNLLVKIMSTDFPKGTNDSSLREFLLKFTEWEGLITEYECTANKTMPDDHKIAHLKVRCPTAVADHLSLHPEIDTWSAVSALVRNFVKSKTEAKELTGPTTNAMTTDDINALHKGKGKGKKGNWNNWQGSDWGKNNNYSHWNFNNNSWWNSSSSSWTD